MRLTIPLYVFCLIFALPFAAEGKWELIGDRPLSSFDMLNGRVGLFAIEDQARVLAIYDNGAITGVFIPPDTITSVIIKNRDTAFISIRGSGVYMSSEGWTKWDRILSDGNARVLAVRGSQILIRSNNKNLLYQSAPQTFQMALGFTFGDTLHDAVIVSPTLSFAVSHTRLYRSDDGGKNWQVVIDSLRETESLYYDTAHQYLYTGGKIQLVSKDNGATFTPFHSLIFAYLAGQIFGSRDCSGAFYIGPDSVERIEMLRSVNYGRFFQEVGNTNFSSYRYKKTIIFDRGSTFFWLDKSGILSVSRDGVDGTIPDSVAPKLLVSPDTGVVGSLCPKSQPTTFSVTLRYDECTGIIIDSVRFVAKNSAFTIVSIPQTLEANGKKMSMTFTARKAGNDTAHLRIYFHSPITANFEQKDFYTVGMGIEESPLITFSSTDVFFDSVKVNSVMSHDVTIHNPGCDTLVVDSLISSYPALYSIVSAKKSFAILPGDSIKIQIVFSPNQAGSSLETITIYTNIGRKYITVQGKGFTADGTASVHSPPECPRGLMIFPNPSRGIFIAGSDIPYLVIHDELGRMLRKYANVHIGDALHTSLPVGVYYFSSSGIIEKYIVTH